MPSGDFQSYGICELFSVFITLSHCGFMLWFSNLKGVYSHMSFSLALSYGKSAERPQEKQNDLNTGQYPYQMFLTGNKGYRCKDKIQMSL